MADLLVGDFDATLNITLPDPSTHAYYGAFGFRGNTHRTGNWQPANGYQIVVANDPLYSWTGVYFQKIVDGTFPSEVKFVQPAQPAGDYRLRVLAVGGRIRAKWWLATLPEPSTWGLDHTDSTLPAFTQGFTWLMFGGVAAASNRPADVRWGQVTVALPGVEDVAPPPEPAPAPGPEEPQPQPEPAPQVSGWHPLTGPGLRVDIDYGCDLLGTNDQYLGDVTDHLELGSVERGMEQKIHGTCRLALNQRLDWPAARVRPWMTVNGERHNLGVYLLETPVRSGGETPASWSAEGYDKLVTLDKEIGFTYRIPAGQMVLASVQAIIEQRAFTEPESKILIAGQDRDLPLPSAWQWSVLSNSTGSGQATWLQVCNDLLVSIGFRHLWVDRDGNWRLEPYVSPTVQAAPAWATYDAESDDTTVSAEDRTLETDLFKVPNQWWVINDDPDLGAPALGSGIAMVENVNEGPTSQRARRRVITRTERIQAVSQLALEVRADQMKEEDTKWNRFLSMQTLPDPKLFHNDVIFVRDPLLEIQGRFAPMTWSIELSGESDTRIKARAVD